MPHLEMMIRSHQPKQAWTLTSWSHALCGTQLHGQRRAVATPMAGVAGERAGTDAAGVAGAAGGAGVTGATGVAGAAGVVGTVREGNPGGCGRVYALCVSRPRSIKMPARRYAARRSCAISASTRQLAEPCRGGGVVLTAMRSETEGARGGARPASTRAVNARSATCSGSRRAASRIENGTSCSMGSGAPPASSGITTIATAQRGAPSAARTLGLGFDLGFGFRPRVRPYRNPCPRTPPSFHPCDLHQIARHVLPTPCTLCQLRWQIRCRPWAVRA